MSRVERYGQRDLRFSHWHRQLGDQVTMIDLDTVEYCRRCRAPLMLIESARDVGQDRKTTIVMKRLAEAVAAGIPAWCVLWTPSGQICDLSSKGLCIRTRCDHGIASFRVRRVNPHESLEWSARTPASFANQLTALHDVHEAEQCMYRVQHAYH